MTTVTPLRDKILVEVLPQAQRSTLLQVPDRDTPVRRAVVKAIGPDVRQERTKIGATVLVNILAGQIFADEQFILPETSILAFYD